MKIEIPVHRDKQLTVEEDADTPVSIEPVETKTIDIYEKFVEFMRELEHDGYRPEKIVMHHEIYRLIKQSDKYHRRTTYTHEPEDGYQHEMFLGMKIEAEELGHESITDFIIYTDRKVVHSEMLEKTFLEDVDDKQLVDNLDVEELVHETNNRIEDREE